MSFVSRSLHAPLKWRRSKWIASSCRLVKPMLLPVPNDLMITHALTVCSREMLCYFNVFAPNFRSPRNRISIDAKHAWANCPLQWFQTVKVSLSIAMIPKQSKSFFQLQWFQPVKVGLSIAMIPNSQSHSFNCNDSNQSKLVFQLQWFQTVKVSLFRLFRTLSWIFLRGIFQQSLSPQ